MHKVLVYLFVLCFLCDTHSSVLQRNNPAWIRKYFGRKTLSLGLALTAFCAYKIYSSYKRNPPKDDSEEKNTIPKSSPSPEKKISDNIIAQPTQKIDTNNTLQHPQKITSDNIVQKKDSEHPEQKHSYKNKAPVSCTSLSLDTTWAELGVIEEFSDIYKDFEKKTAALRPFLNTKIPSFSLYVDPAEKYPKDLPNKVSFKTLQDFIADMENVYIEFDTHVPSDDKNTLQKKQRFLEFLTKFCLLKIPTMESDLFELYKHGHNSNTQPWNKSPYETVAAIQKEIDLIKERYQEKIEIFQSINLDDFKISSNDTLLYNNRLIVKNSIDSMKSNLQNNTNADLCTSINDLVKDLILRKKNQSSKNIVVFLDLDKCIREHYNPNDTYMTFIIDEECIKLLKKAKDEGIIIFALTRAYYNIEKQAEIFKKIGIEFYDLFPENTEPVEIFEDIKNKSGHRFYRGIITATQYNENQIALKAPSGIKVIDLLVKKNYIPDEIVYVDDNEVELAQFFYYWLHIKSFVPEINKCRLKMIRKTYNLNITPKCLVENIHTENPEIFYGTKQSISY